jgi:predicted metal-dependent phosphoesterase TrpH
LSDNSIQGRRWLKAELHAHCSLDPSDYRVCRHTPEQLISHAAKLGYNVLAITCHNKDIWTDRLSDYARNLGITLIPGMEVAAQRRHVLVYNFHSGPENLNTLAKIRNHSRSDTLVIAPHPFFPGFVCLRGLVEKNLDVFDAIEYSGFHIRGLNFNRQGAKLAEKAGKPLVACSDVHHLWQLGRTFTWIYAEPEVESILSAIKEGAVRIRTSPYTVLEAAAWWATALWRYVFPVHPFPSDSVSGTAVPAGPSDKIEDGRCFGAAQQGMKPERIHIGHQG